MASQRPPPFCTPFIVILCTYFALTSSTPVRVMEQREFKLCEGIETLTPDEFHKNFECQETEPAESSPKVFNCSGRDLPFFPQTSLVPHTSEVLDFSHNRLDCLPKINETINGCKPNHCDGCIRDLRLHHNDIAHVHEGAFTSLVCLQSLDLSYNHLTNETLLRFRPFGRLQNLKSLSLRNNSLGGVQNEMLEETHMPHLQFLDLSYCQIEFIDHIALTGFRELQILNLRHNRLKRIHGQTFMGFKSIKLLDLSFNSLQVIEEDTFGDMQHLQDLFLHHNQLHIISGDAFHADAELSFLTLNVNQFAVLPYEPLRNLRSLKKVDVSFNPIRRLEETHEVTAVRELNLDHLSNLSYIGKDAFKGFQRLQFLSLRYAHHLKSIDPQAFRGNFSSLRTVHLDHNGLTSLSQDLLPWQQLTTLTLHDNPWHCDCAMGWAAGSFLVNTTIWCEDPYKLHGQILNTLTPGELSCPRSLMGVKLVVALTLLAVVTVIMALIIWQRRRRMPCWCLRGVRGQYVTVFTSETDATDRKIVRDKEEAEEDAVDDLDLGNGTVVQGGGRVQILLKSIRRGYRQVSTKETESTQDLTLSAQV